MSDLWAELYVAIVGAAYVLFVCIAIEHIAAIERFSIRQRIPGATLLLTGTVFSTVLSWPLQKLWFALDIGFIVVPIWNWLAPLGTLGTALSVIAFLLLGDFFRYWRHRAEHRWFWRIHKVHHAPTELHAANSIGHPLQVIPEFLMVTVPLSCFQLPGSLVPISVGFIVSFLASYIHSPINFHFGPLRRLVVDNKFHRIHHSAEERHFDKNFGICFSIWDAVFHTAHWPKHNEWPKVGLEGERPPRSISDFLLMPFVTPQNSLPEKETVIAHIVKPKGLQDLPAGDRFIIDGTR